MSTATSGRPARRTILSAAGVLVAAMIVPLVSAPDAAAAVSPIAPPVSAMASADALPTVQVNGVVWQQAIVGNVVYAGGNFSTARPAGAAPGTNQTTRNNLLAYNLTSGVLVSSFAPSLNGQVRAVTTSPDGSRLYVGGEFTSVSGVARSRIAAFDTSTGQLVGAFDARVDYTVRAIVATNSTVYVGGSFSNSRGITRTRLAAFNASNGSLLAWNPSADNAVNAMVLAPGGAKIIVGGAFQHVNGSAAYGLAAIDANTAALLPWNAVNTVRDAGSNAAILSLTTDGSSIYGTGYVYGAGGNLEGTFKADPGSGNIQWIEDCHGDTYDVAAAAGFIYTVSHAHYCGNLGGFRESSPRSTNMRHALAFTTAATGTIAHNTGGSSYKDWFGFPSPSLYNWFPDMAIGTFTGQSQAAWDVTANIDYVVMGGEFPTVNGVPQQGLVRFARRALSPTAQGPRLSGANFQPVLTGVSAGTVRVSWVSNWDRDDLSLTYRVIRDNNTANPIFSTTTNATFWNRPNLSYIDAGVAPGSTHSYRIQAVDPDGNSVLGGSVSITAPGGQGNHPPVAAFVSSSAGRTVSVNGAGSSDPDGSVVSYAWNWGDGSPASSGITQSHTYAADGTYTVTLTVTDNAGSTDVVDHPVTATSSTTGLASDGFGRTASDGWGSADVGGPWTLSGGPTKFSVNGSVGKIVMSSAGAGPTANLNGVAVRDLDGIVDVGIDKAATGGGVYSTISTRRIGTSTYQFSTKFLAGGAVSVGISRTVNGAATSLGTVAVAGLTYAAGDVVRTRFQVIGSGTTTLAAKAWKAGTAEPAAFALTRSDSTAGLQAAGAFGIQTYLSSASTNAPMTATVDNLKLSAAG